VWGTNVVLHFVTPNNPSVIHLLTVNFIVHQSIDGYLKPINPPTELAKEIRE
jgi:hypothetical protein